MEMETKMEIMVVVEEEMEKPWKTVNKKKKKVNKKNQVVLLHRPWDALPSLALLNIIRNLNFKDRFGSFAFVCKAWNNVISDDPRCWSSMIPESISPDDAFIKKPVYSVQNDLSSKLLYRRDRLVAIGGKSDDPSICPGVSHFRTLIKKSSSSGSLGGSSTITSLYLGPFHFSYPNNESLDHDEILHLIAHCCPNLKHISFHGFYFATIEAVLEVFHRCKKIELIDFSDLEYTDSVQVIEVLGKCLPHLRGIRMAGWKSYSIHDAIAKHLPRIKLLAVEFKDDDDEDFLKFTSETDCCLYELQYLGVGFYFINGRPGVGTHIPEFHYEELNELSMTGEWTIPTYCWNCQPPYRVPPVHPPRFGYRLMCYSCTSRLEGKYEDDDLNEDYYYCSVLEPKKEDEYYYVSILKEKMKKARYLDWTWRRTRILKKNKMEVSFILKMKMRKKRDKYDYQDYYVQF